MHQINASAISFFGVHKNSIAHLSEFQKSTIIALWTEVGLINNQHDGIFYLNNE
jgi:hypothetical protein